jgi:hypothetical protein
MVTTTLGGGEVAASPRDMAAHHSDFPEHLHQWLSMACQLNGCLKYYMPIVYTSSDLIFCKLFYLKF